MKTQTSRSGEVTLIELLEVIAAIAIGAWLADAASNYFEGIGRKVVYWTIATVGSTIIFFCLLVGLGYLFDFRHRRQRKKPQTPPVNETDVRDKAP